MCDCQCQDYFGVNPEEMPVENLQVPPYRCICAKQADYTVVSGDSLWSIAQKYPQVTWQEIARCNQIVSPYTIYLGQVLCIPYPAGQQVPPYRCICPKQADYTVVSGDSLWSIAQKYPGVTWQEIARCNQIVAPYTIYPGQVLCIPQPVPTNRCICPKQADYTVVSGDSLWSIAQKYPQVTWQEIARCNQIVAPYTIYPGQVLCIPQIVPSPSNRCICPKQGDYTVVAGDSIYTIAQKYPGVSWERIAYCNQILPPYTIYPGQVLCIPCPYHTVVAGESLWSIATKYQGVTWQEIACCNKISSPYTIYPGQILYIPAKQ